MAFLRRIVFYVFVALYLVCCPVLILYALGYVVQPGAARGLAKAGLLVVSTTPPDASVYVSGRRFTKRTPTILSGLLPGEYQVKVMLKDHKPWVRTVAVEAERATVLDHLILLPKRLRAETLLPGPFKWLRPVPKTAFLLLAAGSGLDDLLIYDGTTGTTRPAFPPESGLGSGRLIALSMVRESPCALFRIRLAGQDAFLWADLSKERPRPLVIPKALLAQPHRIEWDPRAPHLLFVVTEAGVHRVRLDTLTALPYAGGSVRGLGIDRQDVYLLTETFALRHLDAQGQPVEAPLSLAPLFEEKGFIHIRVFDEDIRLLLAERGGLFVQHPPYEVSEDGVRGAEFDESRQRFLIWRSDRIGVLEINPPLEMEPDVGPAPTVRWIARGRAIEQAFWVHEGSHALFRDRDTAYLLELEAPGEPAVARVATLKSGSAVAYDEAKGRMSYVNEAGALASVEILPGKR